MEIPLSVTLTGTVVGLIGSALFPWPWPADTAHLPNPPPSSFGNPPIPILGLYPWPVWYPLPPWLPAGSVQLGLATGVAGVLAGAGLPRVIGFLFEKGRGKEGIGDADLMMMVGAFLGWQVVIVAFFVSVFPALVFGILQLFIRGDRPMPFGPSLAAGSIITWLCWRWISGVRDVQVFFFEPILLGGAAAILCFGLFGMAWMLRLVRVPDPPEPVSEPPRPETSPPTQEGQR